MGEFIDLAGQRFGSWTVKRYKGNLMWECECDCGTIKDVQGNSLRSGRTFSCGKCQGKSKAAKGDKFGDWEVIDPVVDKSFRVLCRCSCGKEKRVNIYTLKSGRSTNCGHLKNLDRVKDDIKGRKFGELVPIEYQGGGRWLCKCSCGNTCIKQRSHLLDGRSTSCGHGNPNKPEDLTGQRFGFLEPIKYLGGKTWVCKCHNCGGMKAIRSANLKNKSTVSCGCLDNSISKDELIKKLIQFREEKGYKPGIIDFAEYIDRSYSSTLHALTKNDLAHDHKYIDFAFSSRGERELLGFISDNTDKKVLRCVRDVINPYELDIYIPELKLAFEFNGTYWHSDLNKEEKYHQNKVLSCARLGIRLIHIYEYEWNNKETREKLMELIKRILSSSKPTKLYARELEVHEIESKVASEFCKKYHLQGWASSSINLGLFNNTELLGVMTFGKPRFNNDYQYELIRLVFKGDTQIVGGKNKLFSYFVKKYNPQSVLTYCNLDKFNGVSYRDMGFNLVEFCKPNYVWVNRDSVLTRYQTMKKDLIEKGLGNEDSTEASIMSGLGYLRVYDSGNVKYVWTKNN